MIISDKQHEANKRNAQHSTGAKTEEGKRAIRFNALTFGLRTRTTIIEGENAAAYSQLWDELEADWHPQGRTELLPFEAMVVAQWMLIRNSESVSKIYDKIRFGAERFIMLAYAAKERASLEKSYYTHLHELQQIQKQRRAKPQSEAAPQQPAAPEPPAEPLKPVLHSQFRPAPDYVMSEAAGAPTVLCDPDPNDTR